MRILASNPDTLGDVLLRQPMYHALQEAGHELCLVVRPLLEPLISSIVPRARVIVCNEALYEPSLAPDSPSLSGTVEEARRFGPELLLIAPFQWTALEERLSIEFADIPSFAMTGKRFMDPNFGPTSPRLRVSRSVPVSEDLLELTKNQLLAGAVLGQVLDLPAPTFEPRPEQLVVADSELGRLGLEPGEFWAACVGDAQFTQVRNWEPRRWAEALSEWSVRHKRRFLMIGHGSEERTTREVVALMPEGATRTAIWTGHGDGDLQTLVGLIARSRGYIGRDTGPMHLAAALSKPVLAVFGGGTWPRFIPAAKVGVALTMTVPCSGCGWQCHLSRSHCIKDVPVQEVIRAADDLEAGRISGMETRALTPDAALLSHIGRAGAETARQRLVELSILRHAPQHNIQPLESALERAIKSAARADALADELAALKRESVRRESLLRQRLAAQQNTAAAREADLRDRLEAAEQRLARPTVSPEHLAEVQAAHRQREAELNGHLMRALAELNRRESTEADLKLRLDRLESDRKVLGSLTHQQEAEVVVLRERVNDLLASRWRRYGQRLGLCMKLPWECENGKH